MYCIPQTINVERVVYNFIGFLKIKTSKVFMSLKQLIIMKQKFVL